MNEAYDALGERTIIGNLPRRAAFALAVALGPFVSFHPCPAAGDTQPVGSVDDSIPKAGAVAQSDEARPAEREKNKASKQHATERPSNCLTGRFVYDGDPPERKKISAVHEAAQGLLPSLPADARFESLLVGKNKGIANVFVYVRSKDIPFDKSQANKEIARIHVADGQFAPHALTLQSSQPLHIDNTLKDPINFHTRFWVNDNFNALIPAGRDYHTRLKAEPIPIRFSCHIYPWMHGWMLVADHPYVATSDASGDFTIRDLPAGEWEFQVWHEHVGNLTTQAWPKGRFKLDIREGTNDLGTIEIEPDEIEPRRKLDEEF